MSTQPSTKASVGASVNHLVLNVRDIEVSHRFYTELLGFEQCGDLSHTMTMRFYRGDSSHHHDLALDLVGRLSAVLAVGLGLAERETSRQEGGREHTGKYEPAFHCVRFLSVARLICCAW